MDKITLSLGGAILREIPLVKERLSIGRGPGNDLMLDNLAVSAEHAVIVALGDDFVLEDLNSTNGTQVNGQPIKKHFLQDEDVIEIAQYLIRYSSKRVEQIYPSSALARVTVIDGAGAGKEIALTKALTTIGRPGIQVAAIAWREQGYYLMHVEGNIAPMVNGKTVAYTGHEMMHGDIIDIAGTRMQFVVN